MTKPKKTPQWRAAVESSPGSEYLLSEEEPREFDHIAYLLFLKPSSHEQRDISNKWLQEVVPSLKCSTRQDLQEAGNRLEREWTSKVLEREAFWTDLIEMEKQRKEEKERLDYLKTAGEKRLRSAEGYLVEKTQHDFVLDNIRSTQLIYNTKMALYNGKASWHMEFDGIVNYEYFYGLTSRTFKDTTELVGMDYHGMYRAYCLGSFKIMSSLNLIGYSAQMYCLWDHDSVHV
ncbi:hypothetical protein BGZ83_000733 [Gryganskiella cystojenkinii]|nr:hypothetical protein BGZ83_000733 [Gryganskiella cystojenkinii]